MKTAIITLALLFFTAAISRSQDITGDWNGKLNANGAELRLVLHIAKNPDGTLQATLDSIDQGANGIPLASTILKDSNLILKVDAVNGTYEGKVNADAGEIAGTWTQGMALPLTFRRGGIAIQPRPRPALSDIDGDWLGTLDTGMGKLRVVLHIISTEDGLAATMDSPDQNAKGIPVTSLTRSGSSLKFDVKSVGGSYDGRIAADLGTFTGTWTQLGKSWPLPLKRVKQASELELRRPQNPVKPYPYREEEVSYKNPEADIALAATLTIPTGEGPFPAVLLLSGSGPHDRDESLMGHKPFLVLADYLTRSGIVVLRADKRGVGKSGGDYSKAVMTDFASDAIAGVRYLKTRGEVDSHRIGLLGHSEGGVEAPMAAARNPDVAFVVLMAGPGVPGNQLLPEQMRLIEKAAGKSDAEIAKDTALQRDILALVDKDKDDSALDKDLREKLAGKVPEAQMGMQIKAVSSPWFRGLLTYDPAPTLSQLTCPVLAINGEKDVQVPPEQNLPVIRKALESAGNKNYEVDELPGLNHLFQTSKTGGIGEYSEIEETMSPVAMEKVAGWILQHAGENQPVPEQQPIAPLKQIADRGTYSKSLSL
jgi:pimeloyl-ACP methyl ester carboxylesterase